MRPWDLPSLAELYCTKKARPGGGIIMRKLHLLIGNVLLRFWRLVFFIRVHCCCSKEQCLRVNHRYRRGDRGLSKGVATFSATLLAADKQLYLTTNSIGQSDTNICLGAFTVNCNRLLAIVGFSDKGVIVKKR